MDDLQTIPGYRPTEIIYESKRFVIYRAVRDSDQHPVVIKCGKRQGPARGHKRLRHEYELTRDLDPNLILRPLRLDHIDGVGLLIMEDTGGVSLERLLTAPMEIGTFLPLAIRMADAVAEIHRHHIIHKDIKPQNFIVSRNGDDVKLSDFGIATLLPREQQGVQTLGRIEGTLAYMSPEQTGRMNRALDWRTDLYSLGITYYRMLSGQLPFAAKDPLEWMHCHMARTPLPLNRDDNNAAAVPQVLADIVMTLLAKAAEDRYQSAEGLRADLATCLQQWHSAGTITGFPLGTHDFSDRFQLPQKLYGRQPETQAYLETFARVIQGQREILLVAGYSGIGKSSLVHRIYEPVTRERGYFVSGKFDQFQRNIPYSALVRACRDLLQQILSEPEKQLWQWRERLLEALGVNAAVIIDVIPEAELLLGKQPPAPEIGPSEEQNRFQLVFQNFLRVFSRPEHPLVIFLDDLQWADVATLKLMESILTDEQTRYLFVTGAYRDNEVGPTHPFLLTLEVLRSAGTNITTLTLSALTTDDLADLLADALASEPTVVKPLAELVGRKTGGNPFFISQFLQTLYADGQLAFDRQQRCWQWDTTRIETRGFTDNVVHLMTERLQALSEDTRSILCLAACIGNIFDINSLAIISERDRDEILQSLLAAVREGLIVASTTSVKSIDAVELETFSEVAEVRWRFLHDRVQHAAYSLLDEAQAKQLHLRIGRMLRAGISAREREERLFDIADHLNRGLDLIDAADEKQILTDLNLEAGRRAKHSAAYDAALKYFKTGMELLPAAPWQTAYALTLDLYRARAEAEYLVGNFAASEDFISEVFDNANTVVEKADICNLRIIQSTMRAEYAEALEVGRQALALLDVDMPPGNATRADIDVALNSEMAIVKQKLGDREIASLIAVAEATREDRRMAIRLLNNLLVPAYVLQQDNLYFLITCKIVGLSLEYGMVPESCIGISSYGMFLGSGLGDYAPSYEFGHLGVKLSRRFGQLSDVCRACYILGNNVLAWVRPLSEVDPLFREGYQAGLDSGEFQFAGYMLMYMLIHPFFRGRSIAQTLAECPESLRFNRKTNNQLAIDTILGLQLVLNDMSGKESIADGNVDEAKYLHDCHEHKSLYALCHYKILKTKAQYIHGNPREALRWAEEAEDILVAIISKFQTGAVRFYRALCLIALYPQANSDERAHYDEGLAFCRERLEEWAQHCPANFLHKHLLVEAEMARLQDHPLRAAELYDRAIAAARESNFVNIDALTNELAGRFWMSRNRTRAGFDYLADALSAYRDWGARHKCLQLIHEYPQLVELRPVRITSGDQTFLTTSSTGMAVFDMSAVLKASHAISEEIVLERLLATLMRILLEIAGAQRGFLLLMHQEQLTVATRGVSEPPAYTAVPFLPITACERELCIAAVNYVERTRESLILDDATRDAKLSADPYVQRMKPKSLLCAPLLNKGQLTGIIYIENNLTAGAFRGAILETLRMLSTQAAISIENALLYDNLESLVQERTRELRETQRQLVETARRAGMAEIAANILHNVGNTLNSMEVSLTVATEMIQHSSTEPLQKMATVMNEYRDRLDEFVASEPGQLVPAFLTNLADKQQEDHASVLQELARIDKHLVHVNHIIALQQRYARGPQFTEELDLAAVIDEAIALNFAASTPQHIEIRRQFQSLPRVSLDRHRLQEVLVNLIRNAKQALEDAATTTKILTVRLARSAEDQVIIDVADNGVGIRSKDLDNIFQHGFTTRREGHGFGLHASANAATELGGALRVNSDGPGQGATFTLELPIAAQVQSMRSVSSKH